MDGNPPLDGCARADGATPEALKVFRQLQEEVRLTGEGAAAWKDAVADARQ